jgi:hypothetical protein
MFNLIVAVLSIALVGITAGASVYYGGAAFDGSNNRARAASLIATGGQLAAAQQLYMAENGGKRAVSKYFWNDNLSNPNNLDQSGIGILVDGGYLDAVPTVPTNLDFKYENTPLPQWQIDVSGTIAYIRLSDYVDDQFSAEASTKKLCHDVYDAGGAYIFQASWLEASGYKLFGPDGVNKVDLPPILTGTNGAYEPRGTDLDIANNLDPVDGFLPGHQVTFGCITKPWGAGNSNLSTGRYFMHRL